MLFADGFSYHFITGVLQQYHAFSYPLLFCGAFFETLVPFSFLIYGEIFFLAGSALAGMGSLDMRLVATALYSGGILGDSCSYWLGRYYGMAFFARLNQCRWTCRFCNAQTQNKGICFFKRHGEAAVFLARLCGPFSWFMPSLAGTFRLPWHRFLFYNTLGIIIGIGEFLFIGYFLGSHIKDILSLLRKTDFVFPCLAAIIVLTALAYRLRLRIKRKIDRLPENEFQSSSPTDG